MIKQQIGSKSKPAENAFNIAKNFVEQGFISRKDNITDHILCSKKIVARRVDSVQNVLRFTETEQLASKKN
ncbi:hypothetical protein INT48_006251 [Thamnidium elegans]|uniref:Uncharacterized protein n=1 Tax=Thamnidium elegans TaxID=101142 RepID=A0A8H7SK60_9FUNG|nr:hypothetical protein INT48_006251 [Thamnidium elegans]